MHSITREAYQAHLQTLTASELAERVSYRGRMVQDYGQQIKAGHVLGCATEALLTCLTKKLAAHLDMLELEAQETARRLEGVDQCQRQNRSS